MTLKGLYRKYENGISAGIMIVLHVVLLGICLMSIMI